MFCVKYICICHFTGTVCQIIGKHVFAKYLVADLNLARVSYTPITVFILKPTRNQITNIARIYHGYTTVAVRQLSEKRLKKISLVMSYTLLFVVLFEKLTMRLLTYTERDRFLVSFSRMQKKKKRKITIIATRFVFNAYLVSTRLNAVRLEYFEYIINVRKKERKILNE